jgi:hypothetical protein
MFSDTTSGSNNINSNDNSNNSSSSCSNNNKSYLCSFGYLDYIVLASTLAIALAEELSEDDLDVLSAFFAVLADELALITSIQECSSGDETQDTFIPPIAAGSGSRYGLKRKKKIRRIVKKKIKRK